MKDHLTLLRLKNALRSIVRQAFVAGYDAYDQNEPDFEKNCEYQITKALKAFDEAMIVLPEAKKYE